MTLLAAVNEIRQRLKLPEVSTLVDSYSKRCVFFINDIQRKLMAKPVIWDALKVYPSIPTVASQALYDIISGSDELDVIRYLSITDATSGAVTEIEKFQTDEQFREYSQRQTEESQPLRYRNYTKTLTGIQIEVSPIPDAIYSMDIESVIKPPALVYTDPTGLTLLDDDIIIEGATMLAKLDKGILRPEEGDIFAFIEKVDSNTFGNSNEEEFDVS